MTECERLIDLLEEEKAFSRYMTDDERRKKLADYLLLNGVIVPPCKVGDIVYVLVFDYDNSIKIIKDNVTGIFIDNIDNIGFTIFTHRISNGTLNYDVFLTKKEAEQALKEREQK